MSRVLAVLVVVALGVAACGGESDEESMAADVSARLLDDVAFADYEISRAEADCAGEGMVADLGVERLEELGFGGDDAPDLALLTGDEVALVTKDLEDCIADFEAVVVDAAAEQILDDAGAVFSVDEDDARCVAESITDALGPGRLIVISTQRQRADDQDEGPASGGELTDDDIAAFADAYSTCIDVRSTLIENIREGGADDEVLACLDGEITDADIRALFVAAYAGEDMSAAAQEILAPAVQACT